MGNSGEIEEKLGEFRENCRNTRENQGNFVGI